MLEGFLRFLSYHGHSAITVSIVMLTIPVIFYLICAINSISLDDARAHMWLFSESGSVQWYQSWDSYRFEYVAWDAILANFPAIACLAVYSLVVIPLGIPSLAITTGQDIDFDEELIAMGTGNIISGLIGCPHTLLAYGSSAMFFDLKGEGKYSKLAVAMLTFCLFFVGPSLISYLPRMVASLVMLHLGVDLLKSSLFKSSKSLDTYEYTGMVILGVIVSIFGFVVGMVYLIL